jgi:hypothetical protein
MSTGTQARAYNLCCQIDRSDAPRLRWCSLALAIPVADMGRIEMAPIWQDRGILNLRSQRTVETSRDFQRTLEDASDFSRQTSKTLNLLFNQMLRADVDDGARALWQSVGDGWVARGCVSSTVSSR